MKKLIITCGCFVSIFLQQLAHAQSMDFEKYEPVSTLKVPEHRKYRAKFPFIDVHNHQWHLPTQDIKELVRQMDSLNMAIMINLSGKGYKNNNGMFDVYGTDYIIQSEKNIATVDASRIKLFTNISFAGFGKPGWTEKAVQTLVADVKAGACGLKIYKDLGFYFRDNTGKLIRVDDERLDPIFEKCGELKIPVLIHTADPKSFWMKMDEHNERWLELATHPDRKRSDINPAPWDTLIAEQHHLFSKHPHTTFIAAHFGWYANDLETLGHLLDTLPNVNVEFGAIISDIGRQPKMAKAFFEKYQDRILFGKDSWVPSEYETYFRVLETNDEYFPYHKKYHAFWRMYGLGLNDEVLKKIYYKNALRIIPGLNNRLFPE